MLARQIEWYILYYVSLDSSHLKILNYFRILTGAENDYL
jgi:hypothetical protein